MTFEQVRNAVVAGLEAHIERPVTLSDQIADMPEFPYCYYSVLAPRIQTYSFGLREVVDGKTLVRSEQVSATMSFTFCGMNREADDGYIYGEDEALALAEKAHGFFLLNGHNIATEYGEIVVNNVGAVASRTGFFVEDSIRRYGFDVRFSYVRTDEMPAALVSKPPAAPGEIQS